LGKNKNRPLPANQNNRINNLLLQKQSFSGPLPHPDILRQYDEIIEGGAERIIKMAESQSAHRQELERWAVKSGSVLSFVGVAAALIISLGVLYVSYKLIAGGHTVIGTVLSSVNLVGLVSVFIYGTRSRKEERILKNRQSQLTT
jgi:uncharacterized membrane protein